LPKLRHAFDTPEDHQRAARLVAAWRYPGDAARQQRYLSYDANTTHCLRWHYSRSISSEPIPEWVLLVTDEEFKRLGVVDRLRCLDRLTRRLERWAPLYPEPWARGEPTPMAIGRRPDGSEILALDSGEIVQSEKHERRHRWSHMVAPRLRKLLDQTQALVNRPQQRRGARHVWLEAATLVKDADTFLAKFRVRRARGAAIEAKREKQAQFAQAGNRAKQNRAARRAKWYVARALQLRERDKHCKVSFIIGQLRRDRAIALRRRDQADQAIARGDKNKKRPRVPSALPSDRTIRRHLEDKGVK